jgi:hypothetical protein
MNSKKLAIGCTIVGEEQSATSAKLLIPGDFLQETPEEPLFIRARQLDLSAGIAL